MATRTLCASSSRGVHLTRSTQLETLPFVRMRAAGRSRSCHARPIQPQPSADWAALNGHKGVAKLLCERFEDLNVFGKNDLGKTPLDHVFARGDEDMSIILLNHRSAAHLDRAKDGSAADEEIKAEEAAAEEEAKVGDAPTGPRVVAEPGVGTGAEGEAEAEAEAEAEGEGEAEAEAEEAKGTGAERESDAHS
mmetsp:Transcript_30301/g.98959  ORF Transcript_30301/g.98959 Transcript_30301/m.98959 type:complete len:193 (+) Transcript_30301:89-667(+)